MKQTGQRTYNVLCQHMSGGTCSCKLVWCVNHQVARNVPCHKVGQTPSRQVIMMPEAPAHQRPCHAPGCVSAVLHKRPPKGPAPAQVQGFVKPLVVYCISACSLARSKAHQLEALCSTVVRVWYLQSALEPPFAVKVFAHQLHLCWCKVQSLACEVELLKRFPRACGSANHKD